MSLTVKKLNGDSTFYLTFSPTDQNYFPPSDIPLLGTFTILTDPWLTGDAPVYHPKFAVSKLNIPSCINHLSEIPPPNVVIISQDKPDHCHEATLRQLDPKLPHTIILAHPTAAKKIRKWEYFNPTKIHALPLYSDRKPESIVRFHLPSSAPDSSPGEVTIALLEKKGDMTGLHNAIGITYCRPHFSTPPTQYGIAISTPPLRDSDSSAANLPLYGSPFLETLPPTPPESPRRDSDTSSATSPLPDSTLSFFPRAHTSSMSSATSPLPDSTMSPFPRPQTSSMSSVLSYQPLYAPLKPKTLSVIYSPHGTPYSTLLPYITSHLIIKAALPLTLLMHSFDRVQNPWYLGGNISAGMPGGVEIAQNLLAKCWISAHDEEKEQSGLSLIRTTIRKYTVDEVKAFIEKDKKLAKMKMDIRALDCGEEIHLKA
jgi:hypothetical protein